MADWQVGDLALCVDDTTCRVTGDSCPYKAGRTYLVTRIRSGDDVYGRPATGLQTAECSDGWWNVVRFEKQPRHQEDAFDREVIAHMAGQEVEA